MFILKNYITFTGWPLIGSYLAMTAGAAYLYYLNCKQVQRDELEMRSVEFALTPMLLAERDRNYLKHLRRNREEESKLMANVEGWVTGTWYGEKIYETSDKLVEPSLHDYYVHTDPKEYRIRAHQSLWS